MEYNQRSNLEIPSVISFEILENILTTLYHRLLNLFFLVYNNNNTYNLYLEPITSWDERNNVEASKKHEQHFQLYGTYSLHNFKTFIQNFRHLYVQRETSVIISISTQSTEPILLFEKYISAQNNKVA